ncbi:MAG: DUF1403 family protein, partial [Mesorhizobium sp.]
MIRLDPATANLPPLTVPGWALETIGDPHDADAAFRAGAALASVDSLARAQLAWAGAIFRAWRQLALQPPEVSADRLAKVAELLGLAWDDEALGDLCIQIEGLVGSRRPAPFAAAAIAARIVALRPDAEPFAWW